VRQTKEPEGIALHVDWHIPEAQPKPLCKQCCLCKLVSMKLNHLFLEAQLPILLGQPEENEGNLRIRINSSPSL